MVDKLGTYDNVLGVFADLDDGGLTDDEALSKIREIVGAKKPITTLVLTGRLPISLTVDITGKTVTEFEINPPAVAWDTAETRGEGELGEQLDEGLYAEEIERAKEIALNESEWPVPEVM